jgi:hypothetical protein
MIRIFCRKILTRIIPEKKNDSDVATGMNYCVASISRWSKCTCYLNMRSVKIRRLLKTVASFRRWTPRIGTDTYLPQGQVPRFPHGWLKLSGSTGYPHVDWVDHRWGRVHRKSSARKVTHPSIFLALGGFTKFPWDPDLGLGFKPPLNHTNPMLFQLCKLIRSPTWQLDILLNPRP